MPDVAKVVDFGLVKEITPTDRRTTALTREVDPRDAAYVAPEAVTDPDTIAPARSLRARRGRLLPAHRHARVQRQDGGRGLRAARHDGAGPAVGAAGAHPGRSRSAHHAVPLEVAGRSTAERARPAPGTGGRGGRCLVRDGCRQLVGAAPANAPARRRDPELKRVTPRGGPSARAAGPPAQFFEVKRDRLIRPQQVGQDLLARRGGLAARPAIFEERPQALADRRGRMPSRYSSAVPCRFRSSM